MLILILLALVLMLLILLGLLWKYRTASEDDFAADKAEEELRFSLRLFENEGSILLSNLYVPSKNGGTTEIDLVMITRYGLYVIECKNYSGTIFGKEKDRSWRQVLRNGRKTRTRNFFNPVRQNDIHLCALKHELEGFSIPMFSIIVFTDKCNIDNVSISSPDILLCHTDDLGAIISEYEMKSVWKVERSDMKKIAALLEPYCHSSRRVRQKHLKAMSRYSN